MILASNSITLSAVVDVKATYRYYLIQSSTMAKPQKPTTNPPASKWDDTEPTYTQGGTNSLYFVDLTVFSDGTWSYSEVSLASSYEAAKAAYNKAQAAQESADALNTWVNLSGKPMYSMVCKWTDEAVGDKTEINGGWIKSKTITVEQLAIGSFNNLVTVNENIPNSGVSDRSNFESVIDGAAIVKGKAGSAYMQLNPRMANVFELGDTVYFKFTIRGSASGKVKIGIYGYNEIADINSNGGILSSEFAVSTTEQTFSGVLAFPADAAATSSAYKVANSKYFTILVYDTSAAKIQWYITKAVVMKQSGAVTIADGAITAVKIDIDDLKALNATIAGWSIGTENIYKDTPVTAGTASDQYQVRLYSPATPDATSAAILIRKRNYNGTSYGSYSNSYYVRYDGFMAAYGGARIGAWYVGNDASRGLFYNNLSFGQSGNVFLAPAKIGNSYVANWETHTQTYPGVIGNISLCGISSPNWVIGAGANFGVTAAGALYAADANITGKVTAKSGNIADFVITKNGSDKGYLYYGTWGTDGGIIVMPQGTEGKKTIAGSESIAGWVLGIGSNFGVTTSGTLYANSAKISGAITATSLTLGDGVKVPYASVSGTPDLTVYVQKDGTIGTVASGKTGFKVSSVGLLQASNAVIYGTVYASAGEFTGKIVANTGKIAGWVISGNALSKYANYTSGTATDKAYLKKIWGAESETGSSYAISVQKCSYDGSTFSNYSSTFYVRNDGHLYATSADISGKITAKEGTIGGMSISTDALVKSSHVVAGTASTQYGIRLYAPEEATATTYAISARYRSYDGTTYGSWNYPFFVRYDGYLTAVGGGRIGNWYSGKGSTGMLYNSTTLGASDSAFIAPYRVGRSTYADGTTAGAVTLCEVSSQNWILGIGSNFGVQKDGYLYCSNANISGAITATSLNLKTTDENGTIQFLFDQRDSEGYHGLTLKSIDPDCIYGRSLIEGGGTTTFTSNDSIDFCMGVHIKSEASDIEDTSIMPEQYSQILVSSGDILFQWYDSGQKSCHIKDLYNTVNRIDQTNQATDAGTTNGTSGCSIRKQNKVIQIYSNGITVANKGSIASLSLRPSKTIVAPILLAAGSARYFGWITISNEGNITVKYASTFGGASVTPPNDAKMYFTVTYIAA